MKTSQLTIADNIAGDDLLQIVDVNDPTMNIVTGTNKRITASLASNQLFNLVEANSVVTKISAATNTISGDRLTDNSVSNEKIVPETITDAEIAGDAAISLSKLDTGTLPVGIKIVSNNITDGTIVNADINDSANIALSKLANGLLPTGITINSSNIVNGTITNDDINASAAIALTKLANGVLPIGITLDPANTPTASPNFGTQILTSGGLTASRDTNVIISANRHDTTSEGPELNLTKTRGTIAAPVIVNNNDELGDIAFAGYVGAINTVNSRAASIRAFADGAPSSFSLFANQIIQKIDGPGEFGGLTTIASVDSPSQISITSTSANIAANIHFAVRYSGSITDANATTTITGLSTTAGLFVGQTLRKVTALGGTGAFGGASATIVSIDSTTQITITCASGTNTTGSLTFEYFTTGTISTADTTTTITGVVDLDGFYVGQRVRKVDTGTGAFGGATTITSIDSTAGTITISSTLANTTGSLSFASGWSGTITSTATNTTITGVNSSFSVPGRLTFNTVAPGNTVVTERMRIGSDGTVTILGTVAAFGANNTQVATTAHVHAAVRGAVITITGTSATISSVFYNRYSRFTNSGAITLTLPALTGVPVGTSIKIRRGPSAGVITLSLASGVTVNGNDSTNVPQNGTFELKYISAADGWDYIKYY
jgi:hypothetical protein